MKNLRRIGIVGGARLPFARINTEYLHKSNFDMLAATLKGIADRFGLSAEPLGEVAAGAVVKHTRDSNLTRDSVIAAGLHPQTPAYDVQQACATSLEAAILVGNKIATGQIEVGIAGGVDSASDAPVVVSEPLREVILGLHRARSLGERIRWIARFRMRMLKSEVPSINDRFTGLSMGQHCEQMVKRWNISRAAQDELALCSHRLANDAYDRGFYADLLIPFAGLERDNNLRRDTSVEKLAALRPAFDRSSGKGTITAGNSTPLTDGAAAIVLASDQWAMEHRINVQAYLVDAETAAVNYIGPDAEGLLMAPAYAVPRLLSRNELTLEDFDFYEIHEAFSGQVLCTLAAWEDEKYCREFLKLPGPLGAIDRSRLNVNGGSVGLGHPFAATGARILASAAKHLSQYRAQTGRAARTLVSVCAAGGLGATAILQSD
jgi:acetyl-CoA C-acetyltransferase